MKSATMCCVMHNACAQLVHTCLATRTCCPLQISKHASMCAASKKARGIPASAAAAADSGDEAGPSRPPAAQSSQSDDEDAEGSDDGSGSGDADDSSDCDSHAYVSDSDSDVDGGMARMLQLLEEDKDVPPEQLVVSGKRQRTAVDYRKLNDEMFGDAECYEGEGVDDEFKMRASGARRPRKRSS